MSATRLRLRGRDFTAAAGSPLVMGIVNASPESFSDGAAVGDLDEQVARGRGLVADGADVVDVGGESGVSDRPPVPVGEEIARVAPVVARLTAEGIAVSVDTWKAEVAAAVLEAGALMINDVSGLSEPELARACAHHGAGLVVTHTRAAPKQKRFPAYEDLVGEVVAFLRERAAVAVELGVPDDAIVLDPGPDLAKTPAQTIGLLRALDAIAELGFPVMLAASRKDFIGALTGEPPTARLAGTLAALGWGVEAGAAIVRVHDVAAARSFLRVRAALAGDIEPAADLRLPDHLRREPVGSSPPSE
jgi:dihydropteroate synthase